MVFARASLLEQPGPGDSPLENSEDVVQTPAGEFSLPDSPSPFWFDSKYLLEPEEDEVQDANAVPLHALPKDGKEGALFRWCHNKIGPPETHILCVVMSGRYDIKRPKYYDAIAGLCKDSPWGGTDPRQPDGKKKWCDTGAGKWSVCGGAYLGPCQTGQVKACKGKKENDKCAMMLPGVSCASQTKCHTPPPWRPQPGEYHCPYPGNGCDRDCGFRGCKCGSQTCDMPPKCSCDNGRCEDNGAGELWCNIWDPACPVRNTTCFATPTPTPPIEDLPGTDRRRRRRASRRRTSKRRRSSRRRTSKRRRSSRRRTSSRRRRSKKATSMLS